VLKRFSWNTPTLTLPPQWGGDYKVTLWQDHRSYTKEFISKTTPHHPCPLPLGERGLIISPPLRVASGDSPRRGEDEGEGDTCRFTNDRVSNSFNGSVVIKTFPVCLSMLTEKEMLTLY